MKDRRNQFYPFTKIVKLAKITTCKTTSKGRESTRKVVKSYKSIWLKLWLHGGKAFAIIPTVGQRTDNWRLTNLMSRKLVEIPKNYLIWESHQTRTDAFIQQKQVHKSWYHRIRSLRLITEDLQRNVQL